MLVCDTSGLVAFFDSSDQKNAVVTEAIDADPGPFVVSPFVIAELDYLIATRRGVRAELVVLEELAGGAWELAEVTPTELKAMCDLIHRYQDQAIGVADASLVVLAARYRTNRLLTLDHRHFTVLRTTAGRRFTLVPSPA